MAKMIPIELSEEFLDDREKNGAEIKFFNACKSLPDSWTVLHNVLWEDEFHRPGETDFVVVSPDTGFVAIEVKGGGISRRVKSWYSTNRHGESNKIKNPYDQARNGRGTLIKKLIADSYFAQKYIPSCSMVCFPDIQEPIESIESSREGQILSGDLNNLENFILHFAQMQRGYAKGSLSLEDCQKIVDILIHDFEMPYFAPPEDSTQDNDLHAQEEIIPQPKPIPIASAFHQHKYAMYIVRGTCVSKGYTLYQCECGEEYKENFTPEKEHTFEKTETQEPTCTDSGYDEYTCSVCGEKNRHNIIAKGHSFSGWTEHKPSTCYENGSEIRECLVCGTTETISLWRKPHTFGEWKVQRAPTCTKRGKEIKRCSVCGIIESRDLWKKSHTFGEWKVQRAPTCTQSGKEIKRCSVCGTIESRTLWEKGHTWSWWTTSKSPTCTERGEEVRECLDCGETESRDLWYKEHTFGKWEGHTHPPTCTEGGNEIRECLNCGFSEIRQVEKKGHTFGEWTIQKNPTCTEQGEEIRQCSCCGATEYRALDPVGHKWDQTVERKDKTKIPVCSRCGEKKVDSVIFTLEFHKRQAVIAVLIAILFVSLFIGSILLDLFVISPTLFSASFLITLILFIASGYAIVLSIVSVDSYLEEKRKCNPLKNKVYPQKDKKEHGHLFYLGWLACGFVLALIASIVTGYLNFVQKIEFFGIIWFVLFLPILYCAVMIYAYIRDEILKK